MPLTIRETLRNLGTRFDRAGLDAPALLARRLTAHVLQRPREWLVAHDDETLSASQLARLEALAQRALGREPLAYIVQTRAFYGMDLFVDNRVLVPRPETELLVELAIENFRDQKSDDRSQKSEIRLVNARDSAPPTPNPQPPIPSPQPLILEIGTGSGAAAIAVAREVPGAHVLATDVSADALAVAGINVERQGVSARVALLQSNLLADVPDDALAHVRVLIANLPYVAAGEIDALQPEIASHEPRVALDGGPDGLDLIRALLTQMRDRALPHGVLRAAFFEHGASQGPAARAAAGEILPNAHISTIKDLAKLDRVLAVRF